jgi:hypothetical protein
MRLGAYTLPREQWALEGQRRSNRSATFKPERGDKHSWKKCRKKRRRLFPWILDCLA